MSADETGRGLARALSALVADGTDVPDVLSHLVLDARDTLGASAVAVLSPDGPAGLALLTATSHGVVELEMLQAQRHTGPCVDAVSRDRAVRESGADAIAARWGDVGRAIADAGVRAVEAYPMHWRGTSLGGLNLFYDRETTDDDRHEQALKQAYADMATLVIVQSTPLPPVAVRSRLHDALVARERIEQAKGVVAESEQTDLETAYHLVLQRAAELDVGLGWLADDIVRRRRL